MDKLLDIVQHLAERPHLRSLSLQQLFEFLTRISSLKRSILLAKRAAEPTDSPPDILPRLIQRFLAESIGIDIGVIPDAWSLCSMFSPVRYIGSLFVLNI
jgi:hypothetical protein